MRTATPIETLRERGTPDQDDHQQQVLYRLEPPLDTPGVGEDEAGVRAPYLLVSGTRNERDGVHEVLAVPLRQPRRPRHYAEAACVTGTTNHAQVLARLGYALGE